MSLRIYGTVQDSIVDGPGLRFGVFVQGCPHGCPGCHNPDSHDFAAGEVVGIDELERAIVSNRLVGGVTISGGEPFCQGEGVFELARRSKQRGYDVWIYSGYLFEDLIRGCPDRWAPRVLEMCDVLVDGPFVEGLRSYDLRWRGSANQRVIDLAATRAADEIVLWDSEDLGFAVSPSW